MSDPSDLLHTFNKPISHEVVQPFFVFDNYLNGARHQGIHNHRKLRFLTSPPSCVHLARAVRDAIHRPQRVGCRVSFDDLSLLRRSGGRGREPAFTEAQGSLLVTHAMSNYRDRCALTSRKIVRAYSLPPVHRKEVPADIVAWLDSSTHSCNILDQSAIDDASAVHASADRARDAI